MARDASILILLAMGLFSQSHAIYLGNGNNNAQSLPNDALIPPLVSILDAVDNDGITPTPESTPTRTFHYNYDGIPIKWPFEHDCAATLVGTNTTAQLSYLFTAAHCVTDTNSRTTTIDSPGDKRIIVGNGWCELNNGQCQGPDAKDANMYTVTKILVASKWFAKSQYNNDHDFALLVVKGILKLNGKPIQPMSIATNDDPWRQEHSLYVAGWGTTVSGQLLEHERNASYKMPMVTDRPNVATVTSMPIQLCTTLINALEQDGQRLTGQPVELNPTTMICTGTDVARFPLKTTAPCYGDSGGPLFSSTQSPSQWHENTAFVLVGNVSWSPTLCAPTTCNNPQATSGPTQDCIVNNSKAPQPAPFVYGFPGSVLCGTGGKTSKWYVNGQPSNANPTGPGKTLATAVPGFTPNCQ